MPTMSELEAMAARFCDYRKTEEIFKLKEIKNLSLLESLNYLESKVDERLRFYGYEEELHAIKKKLIQIGQESSGLDKVDTFWFGYEISNLIHKILAHEEAAYWWDFHRRSVMLQERIKNLKFSENLGGRNRRKKIFADFIAEEATKLWSQDRYKNYRVSKMAERLFKEIHESEFLNDLDKYDYKIEDLPASVDAVKKIIRKVAPESAKKAGRPKK